MLILGACPPLDFTLLLEALSTTAQYPNACCADAGFSSSMGREARKAPWCLPQDRGTCKIIFIKSRNCFEKSHSYFYSINMHYKYLIYLTRITIFQGPRFYGFFFCWSKTQSLLESFFNEHSPASKWSTIDRQDAEGNKRWLETRVSFKIYIILHYHGSSSPGIKWHHFVTSEQPHCI